MGALRQVVTGFCLSLLLPSLAAAQPLSSQKGFQAGVNKFVQSKQFGNSWRQAHPTYVQMRGGKVPGVLGWELKKSTHDELHLEVKVGLVDLFKNGREVPNSHFTPIKVPVLITGEALKDVAGHVQATPADVSNTVVFRSSHQ